MRIFLVILVLFPYILYALPKVYVTSADSKISVLDAANNTFIKNFTPSFQGLQANALQGVAISPDQTTAYVVDRDNLGVWVINTRNDSTINFISLGEGSSIPLQITVLPDGSKLYVSDRNASKVFVIKTSDNTVTAITGGATKPSGMAFNPSGTKLYVSDAASFADEIFVYKTSNNSLLTTIAGSRSNFIAVNKSGTGYEPQSTSTGISVFNTLTDTALPSIATSGSALDGVAFTKNGQIAYVGSSDESSLQVIVKGSLKSVIPLTDPPWQVAINPFNEQQLYCTADPNSTVMVVSQGVQINVPEYNARLTQAAYLAFIALLYPPTSLKGQVISNRFVLQTDIIHRLTWNASLSKDVIGYLISRNGALIATVSGLNYDDHNRPPNAIDLYEVRTLDSYGNQSHPVSIYIP